MKTTTQKPEAPRWLVIDAEGQVLGKVSVAAAHILRGKHRADYSPHQLQADHVIVINAEKIALPPKKIFRKTYYRHTGYPGNMKITPLAKMLETKPEYVIEHAVKGMLPRTRLAQQMLRRLHVFEGNEHPYAAQQPVSISVLRSQA